MIVLSVWSIKIVFDRSNFMLNEQLKLKCIHGNDSSKCEKCSILKDSDKMLCIHGRIHNTCGNCIRRKNEKNSALSNCDNFCEHF